MALQIDSITPTSISLTEGQSQQLSVSASGGQSDSVASIGTAVNHTENSPSSGFRGMVDTPMGIIAVPDSGASCYLFNTSTGLWEVRGSMPRSDSWWDIVRTPTGRLLCASRGTGGIAKSDDNGATWSMVSGISNILWGMAVNPSGVICAVIGSSKNIIRSTNNGDTWSTVAVITDSSTFSSVSPFLDWCNDRFVVGSVIGSATYYAYYSSNGSAWSGISGLQSVLYGAIYHRYTGKYIIYYNMSSSFQSSNGSTYNGVSHTGGNTSSCVKMIEVGQYLFSITHNRCRIYTTTDDSSWTLKKDTGNVGGNWLGSSGNYVVGTGDTSTSWVFPITWNPATLTYTLKDATDDTTIGTGTPVTYTAELADNGHNLQWSVTDSFSTVQSALIPVTVTPNYKLIPLAGYKTTIKLAFEQKQMRNNDVYLYDYGSANDQYECEAEYLCDSMTFPIDRSSNVSRIVSQDGFYPFTPFIAVDQIGYDYPVFQGRADGWQGAWFMYKSKIVPDMSEGFSYVDQSYTPAGSTGFSIFGTADLYVPEFNPKTETKYVYGISGSKFREYDTGESTVLRKAKIAWKSIPKNVLVFILKKLIIDTRSSIFTIGFGDTIRRLSPWNVLDGEADSGTFNVKLSSNEIVVENAGGDLWNIEIEVMKWQ